MINEQGSSNAAAPELTAAKASEESSSERNKSINSTKNSNGSSSGSSNASSTKSSASTSARSTVHPLSSSSSSHDINAYQIDVSDTGQLAICTSNGATSVMAALVVLSSALVYFL
jgi:hypothetical protein